jgi:hypothetical protein
MLGIDSERGLYFGIELVVERFKPSVQRNPLQRNIGECEHHGGGPVNVIGLSHLAGVYEKSDLDTVVVVSVICSTPPASNVAGWTRCWMGAIFSTKSAPEPEALSGRRIETCAPPARIGHAVRAFRVRHPERRGVL